MSLSHDKSASSIKSVLWSLLASWKIQAAIMILAPLHVLTPQLYSWYFAQFALCKDGACSAALSLGGVSWNIPIGISGLMAVAFLCLASRAIFWMTFEVHATAHMQRFFAFAVERLRTVHASWFDVRPSGEILQRLFGDFNSLQRRLIFSLSDGQICFVELLSGLLLVAWIYPLGTLPILLFWSLLFWAQARIHPTFHRISTEASQRKGRVMAALSDLIDGAPVYRSYQAENHVLARLKEQIKSWVDVEIHQWRMMTSSWAWMWLMAEAGIAVVMIISLWALREGRISAPVAGMILVAAGQQQGMIAWVLNTIGSFMAARAKALRFLQLLDMPCEQSSEYPGRPSRMNSPLPTFPVSGVIEFRNLTASYHSDSPKVLQGVNLTIPQGTSLALVGRTGAGKSTLVQALFRLLTVHSGDLTINGFSFYDYPPAVTRALFGIVPQDPWLFSGNLRENLDPAGAFSDAQLDEILDEFGLSRFSLDQSVDEGGRNFSLGERQLMCLARCILSGKSIIVMDEPTSHMDPETDARVHKLLRSKLTGRSLIVISHRLETLTDFDQIYCVEMP